MNKEVIHMLEIYSATSPLLVGSFSGEVITKYENTCILKVTECQAEDEDMINELQGVLVVPYNRLSFL